MFRLKNAILVYVNLRIVSKYQTYQSFLVALAKLRWQDCKVEAFVWSTLDIDTQKHSET